MLVRTVSSATKPGHTGCGRNLWTQSSWQMLGQQVGPDADRPYSYLLHALPLTVSSVHAFTMFKDGFDSIISTEQSRIPLHFDLHFVEPANITSNYCERMIQVT